MDKKRFIGWAHYKRSQVYEFSWDVECFPYLLRGTTILLYGIRPISPVGKQ
jgi:hypothetical protein